MVNTVNELEKRNKQLLNEIKQSKEDLKLKIWNIAGQYEYDKNSYVPGNWWYKELSKKWLEEEKVRIENGIVFYDNITIEEMLDNFIGSSVEVAEKCSHYISSWSERGYENTRQRKEFEKKIEELNKYKEQVEDLAGEVRKLLNGYSKSSEEDIENGRIYWEIGEPKELIEKICGEYSKLSEVIMRIVDKWETDAKTHFISLTEVSKEWNKKIAGDLRNEIRDKSKLLQDSQQIAREKERENKVLKDEKRDNLALIKELRRVIKEQETTIRLNNKPLPALPKKQSKLQELRTKIRVKTQQLAEKVKQRSQELFTRIEVRAK